MCLGAPPVAIKTDKTATVQLLLFQCLSLCGHCWKQPALPPAFSSSPSLLPLPYCSIDLHCLDWEWQTVEAIGKVVFVKLALAATRRTHIPADVVDGVVGGVMATHKGGTNFHKVVPREERKHVWGGVFPCTYTHFHWMGGRYAQLKAQYIHCKLLSALRFLLLPALLCLTVQFLHWHTSMHTLPSTKRMLLSRSPSWFFHVLLLSSQQREEWNEKKARGRSAWNKRKKERLEEHPVSCSSAAITCRKERETFLFGSLSGNGLTGEMTWNQRNKLQRHLQVFMICSKFISEHWIMF